MIRAILFDVGGVLVRTLDQGPRRRWEERLRLPPGKAEALVFNSEGGRRAQRGEVSEDVHWAWVGAELGLDDGDLARFRADFFAGDQLDLELAVLAQSLHGPYQTGIISNAFDSLHRVLRDVYPIAAHFDVIVGSAAEGVMKPDAAIYRRALERLGRSPAEAVFIDDMPANVVGAQDLGMAAIHFQPGLDLTAALRHLGVTIDA